MPLLFWLEEWMGAGCVWYPPRRVCVVELADGGVLGLRRSDKIERRRSVPGGTSPEILGDLDEGCEYGTFWWVDFWVGFGRWLEGVGGSGEKMREVVRMEGPRCRWMTSDMWLVCDAYPPRLAGSWSSM